ncbi:MAG TPA: two-component regulator propeller domain-containing protein [Permianibacter sp.]|nr:two-component regulator propeller domain-containing protein [Permianibacter sp.]
MDRWFLGLLLLCLSGSLWAFDAPTAQCPDGFSPRFQRLSLEQGLSQSVVNSVVQDADGFLWFGTQDGLNRYDGYGFLVLRRNPEDPYSLPDNHINVLTTEPNGTLWIGTANGLARRPRGADQIERVPASQLTSEYILSLLSDAAGRLWIGTTEGLVLHQPETGTYRTIVGSNARRLPDEHVRAMIWIGDELWFGTARGIYRYHVGRDQLDEQPLLPERNITSLLLRADGQLVIGTQNGAFVRSADGRAVERLAAELPSAFVQSLIEDNEGRLWIGTAGGLVVLGPDGSRCVLSRQPGQNDSLSVSDVLTLFRDRSGVIWVGTYAGGINKWNSQTAVFQHYLPAEQLPPGVSSNTVSALLRDRQQQLWFGTTDSGLLRRQHGQWQQVPLLSAEGTNRQRAEALAVHALTEDQHGRLWVGTFGAGLFVLNPDGGPTRQYDFRNEDIASLSSSYVLTVFEDHQGEIWVGTENGLDLVRESANGVMHFRRFGAQLPVGFQAIDTEVMAIAEDYDGQLWIGGMGGLVRIDRDRDAMTLYQHDADNRNSLSGNSVTAIRLAPDGDIWVATTDGLNRVHRNVDGNYEITRFGASDGLPTGTIYGILPGVDGELWLSSSSGLIRFQPATPYAIAYRSENGLPSDEFNIGASFLSADGELLFGGINGVVGFLPQMLQKPAADARVVFTGFRKFDQPQSLSFTAQPRPFLQLNSDERVVAFDVAVLDFSAPDRNRFRYRVKGLHEQWITLSSSHTITLTGLDAGRYQLQVQGAPATGLWSNETLTLDLLVRSPFWSVHTSYGSIIAGMVLFGSALSFWWWRRVRMQLRNRQELLQQLAMQQQAATQTLQEHQRYLESLQEQCNQLELQRDELQRRLLENQYRDPLTNLPSRRMASTLFAGYANDQKSRALILVDADGMGFINEQYGYQAGDSVLAQLGDLLQRVCRQGDEIMRWDSDVFLLICEVASLEEARMLAERIRASVLQQAFTLSERRHIDLTCSIGFALWPLVADSDSEQRWEASLGFAREALALAKHFSRNAWFGLVAAPTLPASELPMARRELAREWVKTGWLVVTSSLPQPNQLLQEWPER